MKAGSAKAVRTAPPSHITPSVVILLLPFANFTTDDELILHLSLTYHFSVFLYDALIDFFSWYTILADLLFASLTTITPGVCLQGKCPISQDSNFFAHKPKRVGIT